MCPLPHHPHGLPDVLFAKYRQVRTLPQLLLSAEVIFHAGKVWEGNIHFRDVVEVCHFTGLYQHCADAVRLEGGMLLA